jgi:tripartite ATP-independent transporter DctP family solute receptor
MKKYANVLFVMFSVLIFFLFSYNAWSQEKISIKLGIVGGPDSATNWSSNQLKRLVEERSKGQVEIQVFHSGRLGKDEVVMEGMRIGTHQMASIGSPVPALVPQFGIFDLPFLFPNREFVQKFQDSPLGQELLEFLPSKGLIGIGFWELGFRVITNNVRPIYTPKDLEGLKIRVPSSPIRVKMFQVYGANPSVLSYTELFSALQQGVVDGQENPITSIFEAKFYEVQKYLSMSNHVYTPSFPLASKKHWDKWPSNVRKIILDAAKEVEIMTKKQGAEWDKERIVFLSKHLKVNDTDFNSFQKASAAVYKELGHLIGQDYVDRVLEWMKKNR